MPELPEVQAHAERLHDAFGGAVLDDLEPLTFTALKTVLPAPRHWRGRVLDGVARRGKYLLLRVGEVTFVVHLMQGGRLRPDPKQSRKPRGGLARFRFADGQALLLSEPGTERKAGVWAVEGDPHAQPPLHDLGPEADRIDADAFAALATAHPMRLHGLLRDQSVMAGLGRRLANEVCWHACLSPFAPSAKLDTEGAAKVVAAIEEVVEEGLAAERERTDMSSSADRPGAVHHRVGEACPRCGDTVRAVEYRSYTVAYCPTCQTGGKVLADNTTSRFLK